VQGVGAGNRVELGFALGDVQLKLVQILAVGFGHKHDLLASFLIVQLDESLRQGQQISLNLESRRTSLPPPPP